MSRAFANLDGLMRLSRTDGIDIRPALLRVITDLFVQEPAHTREEVQQYAELSLRLLPVVDAATRAAVVAKLTVFAGTPAWLLEQIGALPDVGTAEPAADAGPALEHLLHGCSVVVTVAVSEQTGGDALATHGFPLEPASARPLGERFLRADSSERQTLLLNLQESGFPAEEPSWRRSREATISRLEMAAREHDPRDFARELQQSFGLSSRIAGEIAYDDGGEPLLVAARAADMHADILLRILLLLNPAIGESVERVFTLYRLYHRIGLTAVAPIMTSWREESRARPKARYQSVLAPDETSGRTGAWDTFRTATESQRERAPGQAADTPAKRHGTT